MSRGPAVLALGVLAAAAAILALAGVFGGGPDRAGAADSRGTASATVKREPLSSQVNGAGTLGFAAQPDGSPYELVNKAAGTYTSLPSPGERVRCGEVLYRVSASPVVLLCGRTPAYRTLSGGMRGPDVRELNRNLVRLGYATRAELDPSSGYFGSATAAALADLQRRLGERETGSLTAGQGVFAPGPLRITRLSAALGAAAAPGAPLAQATSTRRRVEVDLDASQQSSLEVGDRAEVTLPDDRTTPAVVTRIGTVASSAGGSSGGGSASAGTGASASATLPVFLALRHPHAARGLDEAPVQVAITVAGVKRALVVPVEALLAQAGGGYAVEAVGRSGGHRLVPVALGLFDDADGLVQVKSDRLAAGERVVVPRT